MKKITIVLDGVADRPNPALGGRTPLEYAQTPNLDALAAKSEMGLVRTIPPGMEVGSAVGNLSMLGFDPSGYRGRSFIEAAGLGLPINEDDLYVRVNFVTLEGDSLQESQIRSYSAGDISTEQAAPIAEELAANVFEDPFNLIYCGSFRSTLIVKDGRKLYPVELAPAHDIIGQPLGPYLERMKENAPELKELLERAWEQLQNTGTPVNGIWFWGASIVPDIHGDTDGRIALSETLLMDGITKIAGIPNIGTEREGRSYEDFLEEKLRRTLEVLPDYDRLYVHFQETDDQAHELDPVAKARAIEAFDRVFLPRFLQALEGSDYTITLAGDHFTFSDSGAHGGDPVPYIYYDSRSEQSHSRRLTEKEGAATGIYWEAKDLMQRP
ncbi:MAG: hypothetical protein HDQ87_06915 [Clostridia bacterium]|nr:hypothetical protein [Clostridia bacterium]